MNKDTLNYLFGNRFDIFDERKESYDFIENFIAVHHVDWSIAPNTSEIVGVFQEVLKKLDLETFAFLVCHSGYIPEYYGHDSSQETLYSKLIEVLVCEWALRVGFENSYLQTQKGGMEDVSIISGNEILVCDAKTYRLGRSQAAPNVKDTLKKADFVKWLGINKTKGLHPLGGLVTFPSLHWWRKKSDAILYATDANLPIPILFYEDMAFFLIKKIESGKLIDFIKNYKHHFSEPTKLQADYTKVVRTTLFYEVFPEDYMRFQNLMLEVRQEKITWTLQSIENKLSESMERIKKEVEILSLTQLRNHLINSKFEHENYAVLKQMKNIKKFRVGK